MYFHPDEQAWAISQDMGSGGVAAYNMAEVLLPEVCFELIS